MKKLTGILIAYLILLFCCLPVYGESSTSFVPAVFARLETEPETYTRTKEGRPLPPQTGILQDENGTGYYVEEGEFTPYTGLAQQISNEEWFYVVDGYVTNDFTQMELTEEAEEAGLKDAYCQAYARAVVETITDDSMSETDKLWTSFHYVMSAYDSTGNPRIPHYTGQDWMAVYAYDMFGPDKGGNCLSFAAAFSYLAKACGCKEVYACNSGFHGWTEVDGLVYDPEQYHDTDDRKIYGFSYDNPEIDNYWPAISDYEENPWKRVPMPKI